MHAEAAAAARFYHRCGYNPLPSRIDRKAPALRAYKTFRDTLPIPAAFLTHWWTPNVQVPCGAVWGLAVVDLDGPAAALAWRAWCRSQPCPATWSVRTGSGGTHLWFTIPSTVPLPSRRIWGLWDQEQKNWRKHCFIELLGDRALVVAPPSRHVDTGMPYAFRPGLGPRDIPQPAPLPAWVLDLPAIAAPIVFMPPLPARPAPRPVCRCGLRAREVLDRIMPDRKLAMARAWGLRVVGTPDQNGWYRCHALGRDDRTPSAGFHAESGYYCDYSEHPPARSSLFDIAVALGVYADWRDARDALGSAC